MIAMPMGAASNATRNCSSLLRTASSRFRSAVTSLKIEIVNPARVRCSVICTHCPFRCRISKLPDGLR